jgi:DNA/RNA endonuclease YhcR with UshA esterase domain
MRILRILPSSTILAFAAACASTPRTTSPGAMPIEQVRRLPVASTGFIEGVVTVASGTFDSGFAVQDGTGGIYVLPPADSAGYPVGTRLRITGTTSDPQNQLAIQPSRIDVMGTDAIPDARPFRTGAVDEASEGLLIRVRGRVMGEVVDDRPWGWKLLLDDGSGPLLVFVDAQARMDVSTIRPGQWLQVTGYSGQYEEHREILPRTQADLRAVPAA